MIVIEGTFDPITRTDLKRIKQYRKEHQIKDLYIMPSEKAESASEEVRFEMLQAALKPYRHLHVLSTQNIPAEKITINEEEEKEAREGKYRLIADGARMIVIQKGIYLDDTLHHMCKPHRAIHSKGVAETAALLAKSHHLDDWKAYEMGMLHDITKAFSDEENGRIIHSLKPEWDEISPKVWHSFTACVFMKQEMKWYDSQILHAIEHHTLGDGHTDFDRILYIADKIEPGRGYDTTKEMALAKQNLKEASALILKESEEYRKETGK